MKAAFFVAPPSSAASCFLWRRHSCLRPAGSYSCPILYSPAFIFSQRFTSLPDNFASFAYFVVYFFIVPQFLPRSVFAFSSNLHFALCGLHFAVKDARLCALTFTSHPSAFTSYRVGRNCVAYSAAPLLPFCSAAAPRRRLVFCSTGTPVCAPQGLIFLSPLSFIFSWRPWRLGGSPFPLFFQFAF